MTLILVTVGLLVGGFLGYWVFQPKPIAVGPGERSSGPVDSTTAPALDDTGSALGAGQDVWVKSYSNEGELTTEFTARRYEPQKDGAVLVDRPQARFYLRNGQYLVLSGESGVVMTDQPNQGARAGSAIGSQRMQPPRRGELHHVNIFLYESLEAQRPSVTVELNNAAFDNETFRIFTEQYEVDGKTVPADMVPVQVYGEDFEFYGRGLTIQWNELSRRLDLLEVAHGEKLVLKNPQKLGERFRTRANKSPSAGAFYPEQRVNLALVAADNNLAREAITQPATRPSAPIYRARFMRDVRVEQDQVVIATGDDLEIEMSLGSGSSSDRHPALATTDRAPQPVNGGPGAMPSSGPTTGVAPATAPATTSTAAAPLEGLTEPMTVYWTGPLRVTPVETDARWPGGSVVTLVGSPMVLQQRIGRITGASLRYETASGRTVVGGEVGVPVLLRDEHGTDIRTRSIEYIQSDQLAVLHGPGKAVLPVENGKANDAMNASWDQACLLHLSERQDGQLAINRAELSGNVVVAEPRLDLAAQSLVLQFAQRQAAATMPTSVPTTSPTATRSVVGGDLFLERVIAHGKVQVVTHDDNAQEQRIAANDLDLSMASDASGAPYPREIHADGNVHAEMGDQSFSGGRVEITLAPAVRQVESDSPANAPVQIQTLVAMDRVRVTTSDASIQADQARIETIDGRRRITLMGQPVAILESGETRLAGPIVVLEPDAQQAEVRGAGLLHLVQESSDGLSRPVEVTWDTGATLNGRANQGIVTGQVTVRTQDGQGQRQMVGARKLVLTLDDQPLPTSGSMDVSPATAQALAASQAAPSSRPPVTSRSASSGDLAGMGDLDFLRGKRIQSVAFIDDVAVNAHDLVDGQVMRGLSLETSRLDYDLGRERLVIPQAGRMLYEDHRPQTATTSAGDAGPNEFDSADLTRQADLGQMRGLTAIAWSKELSFDQRQHEVRLVGGVRVVHEPEGAPDQRIELQADEVDLNLAPASTLAPARADAEPGLNIQSVRAQGSVYFKARQLEFRAVSVELNPNKHLLIARGTDAQPAELLESTGAARGQFGELWLDTRTQQILKLTEVQGQLRR